MRQGWTTVTVANYLGTLGAVLAVAWFMRAFIFPLFAVKCPDCTSNPLLPVETEVWEKLIYGGGLDEDDYPLPEIIERSYVCPPVWLRENHLRSA